jgi:hypothetical protein
MWDVVAGPTAALLATMHRIKWAYNGPYILADDQGRIFNLMLDPPIAIGNAVKESVRRWRLARVIRKFPACCPEAPDYIDPLFNPQMLELNGLLPQGTVELTGSIKKLLAFRGNRTKELSDWKPQFRASLLSSITGGQWTQSRLASHRRWTDDSACQLCKEHVGNVSHRRMCPATLPIGGWSQPREEAGKFLAQLEPSRKRIAMDSGIILTRIVLAPAPIEEDFRWLLSPPEDFDTSWIWYIDGSFVGRGLPGAGRTGFSIVVVQYDGTLVAYGNGHPPNWIRDASGSEAWALFIAIRTCNYFPIVVTDCYNLLTFYEAGLASSGASHRPLARLWNMIFPLCDEYAPSRVINKLLVWMPSHTSVRAIGQFFRSDGLRVSAIDWRANRLADCLARLAASIYAVPDLAHDLFKGAQQAAEYCAALLGTVTFAANNHRVEVTKPNGVLGFATRRDSAPGKRPAKFLVPGPDTKKAHLTENLDGPSAGGKGVKRGIQLVADPSQPPLPPCLRVRSHTVVCASKHRAAERAQGAQSDTAFWQEWRDNRACMPMQHKPAVSAAERMEALRLRLCRKA